MSKPDAAQKAWPAALIDSGYGVASASRLTPSWRRAVLIAPAAVDDVREDPDLGHPGLVVAPGQRGDARGRHRLRTPSPVKPEEILLVELAKKLLLA
jgi:hypothetical protein